MRRSGKVEGPVRFHCEHHDGRWICEDVEFSASLDSESLIGRGCFASVYRVQFRGSPAAGKTFDAFIDPEGSGLELGSAGLDSAASLRNRATLEQLVQEVEPEIRVLTSILRHPSLCCCLGVGYTILAGVEVPMWFIMELAEANFQTFLHGDGCVALAPAEALRRWIQILIGLDVLHALGVVHMSIKPHNILVRGRNGRVMIADHCFARLRTCLSNVVSNKKVVLTAYDAPEAATSSKADVYAAAILLAEMLTGEVPPESHEARMNWVRRACELLPNPASGTLARAVSDDPRVRPTVAEALFSIFDCQGLTAPSCASPLRRRSSIDLSQAKSPKGFDNATLMLQLEEEGRAAIDALQAEATQAHAEVQEERALRASDVAAFAEVAAAFEEQKRLAEIAEQCWFADVEAADAAMREVLKESEEAASKQLVLVEEGERALQESQAEMTAELAAYKRQGADVVTNGYTQDKVQQLQQDAIVEELRRSGAEKDEKLLSQAKLIDELRQLTIERGAEIIRLQSEVQAFEAQMPAQGGAATLRRSVSFEERESKLRRSWPPSQGRASVLLESPLNVPLKPRLQFAQRTSIGSIQDVPEESELTKVLNRRRNQIQPQERVFHSAEPISKPQADAAWDVRMTLMKKAMAAEESKVVKGVDLESEEHEV